MKLLHIDSSINGDASVSRVLSAAVVDHFRAAHLDLTVVRRDLIADPLPHLTERVADRAILDEFFAADVVVIGAPMYNFTLPTQLKAWIDRLLVPGETFRYSENGPEPLGGNRRIIATVSRGGLYTNTPMSAFEHHESYLRAIFGFIGLSPEIVIAEGVNYGPEQREAAIEQALKSIANLAV